MMSSVHDGLAGAFMGGCFFVLQPHSVAFYDTQMTCLSFSISCTKRTIGRSHTLELSGNISLSCAMRRSPRFPTIGHLKFHFFLASKHLALNLGVGEEAERLRKRK